MNELQVLQPWIDRLGYTLLGFCCYSFLKKQIWVYQYLAFCISFFSGYDNHICLFIPRLMLLAGYYGIMLTVRVYIRPFIFSLSDNLSKCQWIFTKHAML